MHLKRILAAVILAPLFILLVLKGTYVHFSILVVVLALLGSIEYFKMIEDRLDEKLRYMGILWSCLLAGGLYVGGGRIAVAMLTFGLISLLLVRLAGKNDLSTVLQDMGYALIGPLYVGLLFGHLSLLRAMVDGREWVLLLFATIWAGDIAAFYTGITIGRNKLYPEISPNKTVEGAAGCLIGSVMVVLAVKMLYLDSLTYMDAAFISVGIGVMGQLGDLCESMIKRSVGVKDSGDLIPGHGGILDRFDSVLFAAPFLYYYLTVMKGLD